MAGRDVTPRQGPPVHPYQGYQNPYRSPQLPPGAYPPPPGAYPPPPGAYPPPPGQQTPYPYPQPYPQPYAYAHPPGRDGFAIAGFVLSLVGGVVLAVIFCLVALSRIRRSRAAGRRLAIAGLVVCGLWVAFFATAFAVAVATSADRDETGRIVDAGDVSVHDLRPGDCLAELPDEAVSLEAVRCTSPHVAEVVGPVTLPDTAYPGDERPPTEADRRCRQLLPPEQLSRVQGGLAGLTYLYPDRGDWLTGDHEVTCLLTTAEAPGTGLTA